MLKTKEPFWFYQNPVYYDSGAVEYGINVKFVDFEATIIMDTPEFFILDWKNKNGSNDYAMRYIIDKRKGVFTVYGDLGSCVAKWYSSLQPAKLALYMYDINYFIEKITTGNIERHSDRLALQQLNDQKETMLEDYDESDFENIAEIEADYDEMIESYDGEYSVCNDSFEELYYKYNEPSDSSPLELGKHISPRVFLWAAGYTLACEQLGLIKVDREED